jgi:hypothetical protein
MRRRKAAPETARRNITLEEANEIVDRLKAWRCGWCNRSMTRVEDDGAIVGLEGCPSCEYVWVLQGPRVETQRAVMVDAFLNQVTAADDGTQRGAST